MRRHSIKLHVNISFFNDNPWLTIVNDDPWFTIVNDDPSLTIVNDNPSLTIANDDPSLTIVNIIVHKMFFKNDRFLKNNRIKNGRKSF